MRLVAFGLLALMLVATCSKSKTRPRDASNVAEAGAVVSCGSGTVDTTSAACPGSWFGDVWITLDPDNYQGDVRNCTREETSGDSNDWMVSVQRVAFRRFNADPRDWESQVFARRLSPGDECGVVLSLKARDRVFAVPEGIRLRFVRKRVVRHFEYDVSVSVALRDAGGHLMIAWVAAHRPETWDADVLPEFRPQLGPEVVCRVGNNELLSIALIGDGGSCRATHLAASCCRVGGDELVVHVLSASRNTAPEGDSPKERVDLLLARPDVLLPAPE